MQLTCRTSKLHTRCWSSFIKTCKTVSSCRWTLRQNSSSYKKRGLSHFNSVCETNSPHRYFLELFLFHIDLILTYQIGKHCFLLEMISEVVSQMLLIASIITGAGSLYGKDRFRGPFFTKKIVIKRTNLARQYLLFQKDGECCSQSDTDSLSS